MTSLQKPRPHINSSNVKDDISGDDMPRHVSEFLPGILNRLKNQQKQSGDDR
jgi:hypothetical protein